MDGVSSATAPATAVNFFKGYRSPEGARAVLEENQFVERVLLAGLAAELSDDDRAEYRRPYSLPGEGRRPTLTWPQEMPIDGEPADVAAVFGRARDWLAKSEAPKLFINVEPGALIAAPLRKAICRSWPNTTEVTVRGNHFVQEQSPREVLTALTAWISGLA